MNKKEQRTAEVTRNTKETRIHLELAIDGSGSAEVDTGIPFFDHMLTLLARHGLFDLKLSAEGDINVDYHHTVEDTGIVLGQAVREALAEKRGIRRYGFFLLPMDECLARVALDLSNRAAFVYRVECRESMVRDFNIGLVKEFFQAFANTAACNLHINLEYGEEPHHIAEAVFKSFARALDVATQIDPRLGETVPTTKGTLSE
ncbi:MAG: imidazoleglycerol-phosphate dehydratase HisB [Opitutales bacterium]